MSSALAALDALTSSIPPPPAPTGPPPFSPDMAAISAAEAIYNELVTAHPVTVGKHLSAKEREEKGIHSSTLVYGEIRFEPFAIAVQKIKYLYGGLKPDSVFYDIGSGTGKPVFAAALLHSWRKCVGVEILSSLHAVSLELLDRWRTHLAEHLPPETRSVGIEFICDDATTMDWGNADVVFMNSTCFDEFLMHRLAEASESMKVGSFAITFTKRLPSDKWMVLESEVYTMSWGAATVFIQEKMLP